MDLSASTSHLGSQTSTTHAALSLRCSWDSGTRHPSKLFHYVTRKNYATCIDALLALGHVVFLSVVMVTCAACKSSSPKSLGKPGEPTATTLNTQRCVSAGDRLHNRSTES